MYNLYGCIYINLVTLMKATNHKFYLLLHMLLTTVNSYKV